MFMCNKKIFIAGCMAMLASACTKKQEFGNTYVLMSKSSLKINLTSSYFAIGADPNPNEKPDTVLSAAGVYRTGLNSGNSIQSTLIIDSLYVKELITKANDPTIPDAEKPAEILAYKDLALLPAHYYKTDLNSTIADGQDIAPVQVTLHKQRMADLSAKKKWVIPFRLVSSSIAINASQDLTIFELTLVKPKPVIGDNFVNLALNKTATASSNNETAKLAVDGDRISNTSRWVATATTAHWLEVDLGQEYPVNGFSTWIGYNGVYENAVKEFYFQVFKDGEWQTIESEKENTDAKYISVFPEVKGRKFRYYVPFYTGNTIRLFELEIYSKIK